MEMVRGRASSEELADKIWSAASPVGAGGVTPEPAFLLQEVEEDETPEEFLHEVPDGLERPVSGFRVQTFH